MALTTEQLLLLNNLMYTYEKNSPVDNINDSSFQGKTVGEYINAITNSTEKMEKLLSKSDCGCYMSGKDYEVIFNAIKSDEQLMEMKIASTHIDNGENGGGGFSAVFIDESTGNAVVTFKGTEPNEWPDNFTGATTTDLPDGVSTQHQANSLEWYQDVYDELGLDRYDITVTGHSKGGNKAKYITVMDDSVDHCVSFDGQGFSDEFLDKYHDNISVNQHKIENHNADNDFVNILLNDIGETHYYESNNIDKLFEYHSPNSFFSIDESGKVCITETAQGEIPLLIDRLLTGLVRSMPSDMKKDAAGIIGEIVIGCLDKKGLPYILDIITNPENTEEITYILAYAAEYIEALPATIAKEFTSIPGLSDFLNVVNIISNLDNDIKLTLLSYAAKGLDFINDSIIDFLEKTFGIDIKNENIDAFLEILENLQLIRNKIKIGDNEDRKIASGGRGNSDFSVETDALCNCSDEMQNISRILEQISDKIENCKMSHTMGFLFNARIMSHASKAQKQSNVFAKTSQALNTIAKTYKDCENRVTSKI